MTNLSQEICHRVREERHQKGWSQADLALRVGCKQSAISMFEKGLITKVSEDIVRKIADELKISLDVSEQEPFQGETSTVPEVGSVLTFQNGFCTDCDCPSNIPYLVGSRLLFRPFSFQTGRYCAHCGEILEKRCPACGSPLNVGACCAACGKAYVTGLAPTVSDITHWISARYEQTRQILGLIPDSVMPTFTHSTT